MADSLYIANPAYLYSYSPFVTTNVETAQVSPLAVSFSIKDPLIETGAYTQYYADINTLYDIISGAGTSASPFNFSQMLSRITSGGAGEYHDSYNIRGGRTLQSPAVSYENWHLKTDPSKNFLFQAWNLSAYGPWMLTCYCNNTVAQYNPKISFAGATLMNGIIYNVPWVGVGHEIEISITYDMWINSIGTGGGIKFYPTKGKYEDYTGLVIFHNDCYIVGSTIYPENGITDNYQSNYDLNIIDTVCKNFIINSDGTFNHFSGCTLNSYNSGFDIPLQITRINIYDTFDSGIINPFWYSAFGADYTLAQYPSSGTNYAASATTPDILTQITPEKFDGDFDLEYGIITSTTNYSATGKGIGVTVIFDNGGYDYFGVDELLNTSIMNSVVYKSIDDAFSVIKPFTFSAYKEIKFKLIRQGNTLSAYTNIGSGWEFVTSRVATNSVFSPLNLYVTSENNYGFSYFNFVSMAFYDGVQLYNQTNGMINYPTIHPFTPGHPNYLQNLSYVIANKYQLKPFNGIATPPDPGRNYPTYPSYTTGLFGYSRKDYVPNF